MEAGEAQRGYRADDGQHTAVPQGRHHRARDIGAGRRAWDRLETADGALSDARFRGGGGEDGLFRVRF